MPTPNACQQCGACCAYFRVSFHWSEADPASGGMVPPEVVRRLDPHRVCMAGTDQRQPRCIALEGTVGAAVNCTIYPTRPSPCREFAVDWVDGLLVFAPDDLARCTQARAFYGLPPLLDEPGVPPLPGAPDLPDRQAG